VTEGVFLSAFAMLETNTPIPPFGVLPPQGGGRKRARGEDNNQSIPPCPSLRYASAMSFTLAPFAFALSLAVQVHARVACRDELMLRPQFVKKAVAGRLRAGIRALAAFLRRLLILMALEIEHDLVFVWQPENLARAKARLPRLKKPFLRVYPHSDRPYAFDYQPKYGVSPTTASHTFAATLPPITVLISHLLSQLDHLHAIALNPMAKARRLAFTLAGSRHGILMAPPEHPRVMRRQGTEATAIYAAMGYQIMEKSRTRPPPQPPPRRGPKPMITVFY
jgi:hypothetical protein